MATPIQPRTPLTRGVRTRGSFDIVTNGSDLCVRLFDNSGRVATRLGTAEGQILGYWTHFFEPKSLYLAVSDNEAFPHLFRFGSGAIRLPLEEPDKVIGALGEHGVQEIDIKAIADLDEQASGAKIDAELIRVTGRPTTFWNKVAGVAGLIYVALMTVLIQKYGDPASRGAGAYALLGVIGLVTLVVIAALGMPLSLRRQIDRGRSPSLATATLVRVVALAIVLPLALAASRLF